MRERDPSIKAVLNKLGAFVTYDSIRDVVGQGDSTIRPRDAHGRGDVLLVDLVGCGRRQRRASSGRCSSAATTSTRWAARGPAAQTRRQHLLIVDEAPAVRHPGARKILDEGRKFGLVLVTRAQSLSGLGETPA